MFDGFRRFLSEVIEGGKHPSRFEANDYRLAAAGLLVHTAAIDGNISELERQRIHAVIKRAFALDDAATTELVAEATEAEHEMRGALLDILARQGRYSIRTAQILQRLALILSEQGRHEESQALARAAVDIHEKVGAGAASCCFAQRPPRSRLASWKRRRT